MVRYWGGVSVSYSPAEYKGVDKLPHRQLGLRITSGLPTNRELLPIENRQ